MAARHRTRITGRRADREVDSLSDVRAAAELLREAVKAVTNGAGTAGERILFPRGIELIHLNISAKEGRVEIKVAGPSAPAQTSPAGTEHLLLRALAPPPSDDLVLGEMVPNQPERDVVGLPTSKIIRGTSEFQALVRNDNPDIVFKDEDPNPDCDHMMTQKLRQKVDALAALTKQEWSGVKLRVTEAWDENNEHGPKSVHYEARGVDLTTFPIDGTKLGRLGRLAVSAGFEWVFYENALHIHASVSR